MTLKEFLESEIALEGYRKIQCWESEDGPTVYHEGFDVSNVELEEHMGKEIAYIFSYMVDPNTPAICIELAEE